MEKIKCSVCGYDKHIGSLHIHHIDHNHKNDLESNLIVLCSNCHMEHHHKNTYRIKHKKDTNQKIDLIYELKQEMRLLNASISEKENTIQQYQHTISDLEQEIMRYKKQSHTNNYKYIFCNNWIVEYCNKDAIKYIQDKIKKIDETGEPI